MAGEVLDGLTRQCLETLRANDPDRYTATLYLSVGPRAAAAAIYAFDAEIARIADRVSEPMPGEIRLQWWREVVEGGRESGNHPVAQALLHALAAHDLPREPLLAAIDARIFDLYHDPMPDRAALEAYCGESGSVLLQLVAFAAGAQRGSTLADACGHGGVALRLVDILRRAPVDRAMGRCPFPVSMLAAAGLDAGAWLANPPDERHAGAVSAFAALAREHLGKAMAALAGIESPVRPVFLPLAVLPAWLDAAERAGNRVLSEGVSLSPLRRQWIFLRSALATPFGR